MVAAASGLWPIVTWPQGPWRDLTHRATGSVSQCLFLWSAGMKVVASCPKMDRQGSDCVFVPICLCVQHLEGVELLANLSELPVLEPH